MSMFTTLYLVPENEISGLSTDPEELNTKYEMLDIGGLISIHWEILAESVGHKVSVEAEPITFDEEGLAIFQWDTGFVNYLASCTEKQLDELSKEMAKIEDFDDVSEADINEAFMKLSSFCKKAKQNNLLVIEYATF